jgi:hypothetical protein
VLAGAHREPGIGKTRLLAELAGLARDRGLRVLDGRAAELEHDLTFALLGDALEPLLHDGAAVAELEGWQRDGLAALVPAVGAAAAPLASYAVIRSLERLGPGLERQAPEA